MKKIKELRVVILFIVNYSVIVFSISRFFDLLNVRNEWKLFPFLSTFQIYSGNCSTGGEKLENIHI